MKSKYIALVFAFVLSGCTNPAEHIDTNKATVKFETFGGTKLNDQIVDKGSKASYPGDVILEDYSFNGFYTCNGFTNGNWGNYFDFSIETIYDDITLYAKLIKNVYHSVEFYSDDVLLNSISKVGDGDTIEPFMPSEKEGYVFVGYVVKGETNLFDFSTPIYQDYKFEAKWVLSSNITLDYNGATHGIGSNKYSFGNNEAYELPRPYKNDATFLGWFTAEEQLVPQSGIWTYGNNVALHAKFKNALGNLSYFDNGAFIKVSVGENTSPSVFVPEWHNGKLVKEIGESAFEGDSIIKEIEFSNGLTDIGKKSFYQCSLEKVILPGSLYIIGEEAFAECTNLTTVSFNEGLSYLGLRSFYHCNSLKEVLLPSSLIELRGGVFNECSSLRKVTFQRSISTGNITKPNLSNRADFRKNHTGFIMVVPNDSIEEYKMMYSTQYVWSNEFTVDDYVVSEANYSNDGLYVKDGKLIDYIGNETSLTLPNAITSIGTSSFYLSNVNQLTLSSSTTNIVGNSFMDSSISKVVFQTNNKIELTKFSYGGVNYNKAFKDNTEVVINYPSSINTDLTIFNNVILTINKVNVKASCYVDNSLYTEVTALQGELFAKPVNPTKEGLAFAGWFTSEGVKFDFDNQVAIEDIQLYARFAEAYTISINYNGAFLHGDENITICKGETYSLTKPGKNDAQFINYTLNGDEFPINGAYQYEQNIQITANFVEASSGLTYASATEFDISGLAVNKGTFTGGELIIPEYHNSLPVISTGAESFLGMSTLTDVYFPSTLIAVCARSFRECTNLTTFDIPESCRKVYEGAFYGDTNLVSGTLHRSASNGVTQCGNTAVLRNVKTGFTLYVPSDSVSAYKNSNWGKNTQPEIIIKGIGE